MGMTPVASLDVCVAKWAVELQIFDYTEPPTYLWLSIVFITRMVPGTFIDYFVKVQRFGA